MDQERSLGEGSEDVAPPGQWTLHDRRPHDPPALAGEISLRMRYFDVFNGDADGICALHQLRMEKPVESTLVTGLKHEIALLDAVDAGPGDIVTVLDLSMERNRQALRRLLARGALVRYYDHHDTGGIPDHEGLVAVIDTSADTCTSVIVDGVLHGRFRQWAVVGAFGDNQHGTAEGLAHALGLDGRQVATLRELGEDLNYNAYGRSEPDVMIAPRELYRIVRRHVSPFDLAAGEPVVHRLKEQRESDLAKASCVTPVHSGEGADAWVLPDEDWSRRVSGTLANRLAIDDPSRAHAVLTPIAGDAYRVSVRSPRGATRASDFCRAFASGGGRACAAGVEELPRAQLGRFVDAMERAWGARTDRASPQSAG